ncbi:acyl-CoA dehydrogenase [Maritalea sp.]|uniref:acyl-CoA dehydrogenase n=1 Tax=Maritalea sp. TaxID=2003361 RepID=UPI003EF98DCB
MAFILMLAGLAAFFALALIEARLVVWGLVAIGFAAIWQVIVGGGFNPSGLGLFVYIPGILMLLLSVPLIRRLVLTAPIYGAVKKILPRVSSTEQEALDAGTVGWDAQLFSGKPDWSQLLDIRKPVLTAEEQAFMDGPAEEVCGMIDDWDTRHNRADMPDAVWTYLKENRFLGMLISKEHGGLGFSAQAQSMIVSKVACRSIAAGISVMVPNSLGPGELLEKYGTDAQKDKYLERLATGKEVPCFALTGPHAGSDAAGMRDAGVVCYGEHEGKEVLGVKLNWDKRYITLGPVATLLGLAFNLYDPENLLGKGTDVGITLALIPTKHEGVNIGRRHYPSRSAFMNGPNSGKDVFIPLDWIIGGTDYCGQGWRMLMECLSTGRAISLPAIGTVSIKQALRVTSAYARIRRQFSIPVGMMEGVAEPLSRIVKDAYMFEGSRAATAAMVDEGQKPSVISALLKYRTTQAMRDRLDDAMDIHGGRAVCDGPSNYLFSAYQAVPVAITVEGANILTRTLITFAQGALRAHPFLYSEISAAQNENKSEGLKAFDKAFAGHTAFMLRNITGSLFHNITFGAFASSPSTGPLKTHYQQLHRYAQSFALVGDWTVVVLGGDIKRKQMLSGRMADILSDLYLWSTTLKRYEDDGSIAEDLPIVEAIVADRKAAIEKNFLDVFANFPNGLMRFVMRRLVFPFGAHATASPDRVNYKLAKAVLKHSDQRDRLTRDLYVSFDPEDRTGVLEDALIKVEEAADAEKKFIRALKKGMLNRRLDRDAIEDAVDQNIISHNEAGLLRAADEATDNAIRVDDFAPDELAKIARKPQKGDHIAAE